MYLTILFLSLFTIVYILNKYVLSYWSNRGFPQSNPKFLFGDAWPLIRMKVSPGEFFRDIYFKHKDKKVFGVYVSYSRILTVHDPLIVQDIMIRDFSSFHDRPIPMNEDKDPLSVHLFNLKGQKWRDLRVKLSPTFTPRKIKGMFQVIRDCGTVLEEYLARNMRNGTNVFEFRDLMARFNTNIISSVAFGIDNDCINERDHIFRKMGVKVFAANFKSAFRSLFVLMGPKCFQLLGQKTVDDEVEKFITTIVKQTVELREKNDITRNDFMQLLMQLKNQGFLTVDREEKETEVDVDLRKLTMNQLTANACGFPKYLLFT